jgi:hypothetical protein
VEIHLVERRKMIVGQLHIPKDLQTPRFSVVILDDIVPETEDSYLKWEELGFVVKGRNSGHHFLQCTIFAALQEWMDQWTVCLDYLDSVVTIEVRIPSSTEYLN